jgi:hypothetical protein
MVPNKWRQTNYAKEIVPNNSRQRNCTKQMAPKKSHQTNGAKEIAPNKWRQRVNTSGQGVDSCCSKPEMKPESAVALASNLQKEKQLS